MLVPGPGPKFSWDLDRVPSKKIGCLIPGSMKKILEYYPKNFVLFEVKKRVIIKKN